MIDGVPPKTGNAGRKCGVRGKLKKWRRGIECMSVLIISVGAQFQLVIERRKMGRLCC